jgi:hypothetical protein
MQLLRRHVKHFYYLHTHGMDGGRGRGVVWHGTGSNEAWSEATLRACSWYLPRFLAAVCVGVGVFFSSQPLAIRVKFKSRHASVAYILVPSDHVALLLLLC